MRMIVDVNDLTKKYITLGKLQFLDNLRFHIQVTIQLLFHVVSAPNNFLNKIKFYRRLSVSK